MRYRQPATLLALIATLFGCVNVKDPISDKHDIVVRTASRRLTSVDMGMLLGEARIRMPLTSENGEVLAKLWSGYHRLGVAAAHADTLMAEVDPMITSALRVTEFLQRARPKVPGDTATKAAYDSAKLALYELGYIEFAYPANAEARVKDSVASVAGTVLRQLTPANFEAMAEKYSSDKRTAAKGGTLGIVQWADLNPEVMPAVRRLKPDSISKLVDTKKGIEIIRRVPWAEAKGQFAVAYSRALQLYQDSVTTERMARSAHLTIGLPGLIAARDIGLDLVKSGKDTTTVATFDKGGRVTVANLLVWVDMMQGSQRDQLLKRLQVVPDSVATGIVRLLATRQIILRAADSARIQVADSARAQLRDSFRKELVGFWRQLNIAPDQLAPEATTPTERERLAAQRVDEAIKKGLTGESPLPPVPVAIEAALNLKYETVMSEAAVDQAVEIATRVRRAADSTRGATPVDSTLPRTVQKSKTR